MELAASQSFAAASRSSSIMPSSLVSIVSWALRTCRYPQLLFPEKPNSARLPTPWSTCRENPAGQALAA